jgi:sec-independent protein translocase protein TatA
MGPIGFREIAVIVLIVVLLFGAKRIPELMRSIGTGFREFKQGISGDDEAPKRSQTEIDRERNEKTKA